MGLSATGSLLRPPRASVRHPSSTLIFSPHCFFFLLAFGLVQLSSLQKEWFALIVVAFAIFVVVSVLLISFKKSREYFLWLTSLPMIGFHLISICAEISFIVAVSPFYLDLFVVAIAALGGDTLYNSFCAAVIFGTIRKKLKNTRMLRLSVWPTVISFGLSLVNAAHLNILLLFSDALDQDITNTGSAMSLNKVLKNVTMVVISAIAISRHLPSVIPLIVIILAGGLLLWDLLIEGLKWCLVIANGTQPDDAPQSFELRTGGERDSSYSVDIGTKGRRGLAAWKLKSNVSLLQPEDSNVSLNNQPPPSAEKLATHEEAYCALFACFVTPFVVVSFLPHFLSLVGIPLGMLSLRRFWVSFSGSDAQYTSRPNDFRLSWFASRGVFLLPFSILGMTPVFLVFFAVNFVTIVILYALRLVGQALLLRDYRESVQIHINSCHVAYRFVLSCLLWAFLPHFDRPPLTRSDKVHKKRHVLLMLFVIGWFLVSNFALPIVTVVFDFLYSFTLLQQSADPALPTNEERLLSTLMTSSFVFTVLGLFAFLCRSIFLQILIFRKIRVNTQFFTRESFDEAIYILYDFALDPVPPVTDNDAAAERRAKKINSLFLLIMYLLLGMVALAQTVLKVFSVSYVGIADSVWIITLTVSVLSLSLAISVQLTKVAVGRAPGWLRVTLNTWLFAIIAAILAVLCARFTFSRFCEIPKTLTQLVELDQIENCDVIGFNLVLYDVQVAQNLTFHASSILGLNLTDNPELLSLSFDSLGMVNTSFAVADNPVLASLDLGGLRNLSSSALVSISGNSRLASFSANNLNLLTGTFEMDHNVLSTAFALPSLISVSGSLSLSHNPQPISLGFPNLQGLAGSLQFAFCEFSAVDFSSFSSPAGTSLVQFSNNTLPNVVFPALQNQIGQVVFQGNTGLDRLTFLKLEQITGEVTVSGNLDLQELDFTNVATIAGSLKVTGNPRLTLLDLSGLVTLTGSLEITNNLALESISLPSFIGFLGTLEITNNPNLVNVTVPQGNPIPYNFFAGSSQNFTLILV